MHCTSFIRVAGLTAVAMCGIGMAPAQDFPSKPIRIMTQPTGGGTDFASRLIAAGLPTSLGQPVVVDNRAGIISIELVAKAPPDGYTLLLYANGMWTEPLLRDNVTYDPVRDFLPVTQVAISPNILVVHPSLPVRNVSDLITLAKSRPGDLNYASGGGGTPNHLAAELFKAMARVSIVHVPYKGAGAALTALVGGEVQMALPNAAGAAPLIRSGKLRALGVTSLQPSVLFPGLPAVAASGLPGYESAGIVGIFVAAKTPPMIVLRLNQEIVRVLNRTDIREKFQYTGVEVVASSPEEFAAVMKADMAKWGKVIRDANIRAE